MGDRPYRDWHDVFSLIVETLGFGAVIMTIVITLATTRSNDADMAKALSEMGEIANSMHSEAEAIAAQRPTLERQAKSAADSAEAAKTTAALARGQTAAIVQQAQSLVRGAEATIAAAQAQLASAEANTRTAVEGAKAAEAQRLAAELFASTRAPLVTLSEANLSNWAGAADDKGQVPVTVQPHFTNTGGAALFPLETSFSLLIIKRKAGDAIGVPRRPNDDQHVFGYNTLPTEPFHWYFPQEPFNYSLSKKDIDAVNDGKAFVFVWGHATYRDSANKRYKQCYVAFISPPSKFSPLGNVREVKAEGYDC